MLIGEVVLLVGFIWASFSNLDNGYLLAVALPMLLIGLGQGLILAPVTAAGIYQAPNDLAGAASGLTNTMHQVGGAIGLSLLIAIGGSFSTSLLIMALFTAIALILVYFLIFPK